MSSPVVRIEKIEYVVHNHVDMSEVTRKLNHIISDVHEIRDDVKLLKEDPDGDLKKQILDKLNALNEDIKKTV